MRRNAPGDQGSRAGAVGNMQHFRSQQATLNLQLLCYRVVCHNQYILLDVDASLRSTPVRQSVSQSVSQSHLGHRGASASPPSWLGLFQYTGFMGCRRPLLQGVRSVEVPLRWPWSHPLALGYFISLTYGYYTTTLDPTTIWNLTPCLSCNL